MWKLLPNGQKQLKEKIKETLLRSYEENKDFIITKDKDNDNRHGGSNSETILITRLTFKLICMSSKTDKA